MLAGLLANTDKIISSNDRWNYADNLDNDNKTDAMSDGELDADINDFVAQNNGDITFPHIENNIANNVFKKDISDTNIHNTSRTIHQDSETAQYTPDTNTEKSHIPLKKLSREDLMLVKLDMLRKLGELKQCGVHLSQNYNLDSDLKMMEYEYKLHHDIRSKQNSVQWMSHMLIGVLKGTEMLNDTYNPFDIKLHGLSDKVSSDMHNYYSVLGDIYEKYNKPGKQMAPELRLLLMISGATLSMQVNRALPSMMGNLSSNVKNDASTLNELRQKAEADSKKMDSKTKEYIKKQHDDAKQKATDLNMLKEKELEYQRLSKLMDSKNGNIQNIKNNLILSTESPMFNEPEMTHDEIKNIQKIRYKQEEQHLNAMRHLAHQQSEQFRNNKSSRKKNLEKQNIQLDNILHDLEDNKSQNSNASSISINPNFETIMNNTFNKARKDYQNKTKDNNIDNVGIISFGSKNKGKSLSLNTGNI
jgi:hypothetical protein